MTDQPSLFDLASPHAGMVQAPAQAETSAIAAERIAPDTGKLRLRVLRVISSTGGCTDEEGIHFTDLSPSTYRPRRVELHKGWRDFDGGYIEDSGERRPTASGRSAIVWRATSKGRTALEHELS